jgi:hypothetical protein
LALGWWLMAGRSTAEDAEDAELKKATADERRWPRSGWLMAHG